MTDEKFAPPDLFQPHLIIIHPNGKRESQEILDPPSAEQMNYLTDGWGTHEVPWWTTYTGKPCVAYYNSLATEPNATASKLWMDQTTVRLKEDRMSLRGAVVLVVAASDFLERCKAEHAQPD
jgi:hypothetical protein